MSEQEQLEQLMYAIANARHLLIDAREHGFAMIPEPDIAQPLMAASDAILQRLADEHEKAALRYRALR